MLQNPLHRLLGVAEVRVETASGSEPDATLRVLSLADVDRLKHELHDEPSQPDEPAADTSVARADEPTHRVLLRIAPREQLTDASAIARENAIGR